MGNSSSSEKNCNSCSTTAQPAKNLTKEDFNIEVSDDVKERYKEPVLFKVSSVIDYKTCHVRIVLQEDGNSSQGLIIHLEIHEIECRPVIECLRGNGFSSSRFKSTFICKIALDWSKIVDVAWPMFKSFGVYEHFARKVERRLLAIKESETQNSV